MLLLSATFPQDTVAKADAWLRPGYARVGGDGVAAESAREGDGAGAPSPLDRATQVVQVCAEHKKPRKLLKHLDAVRAADGRQKARVIVFANRIKTVKFVAQTLHKHGHKCAPLHGELRQEARDRTLAEFRAGKKPTLVATDVAGRGLHVPGLEHVVNYDFPGTLEQYVHRVGRVGRASGSSGHALSYLTRSFAPLTPALVRLLEHHGQPVDPNLATLASAASAAGVASSAVAEADGEADEEAGEAGGEAGAAAGDAFDAAAFLARLGAL